MYVLGSGMNKKDQMKKEGEKIQRNAEKTPSFSVLGSIRLICMDKVLWTEFQPRILGAFALIDLQKVT
jgi:hypothetical protein